MVMVAGHPGITYAVLALVLFGISILGPVVSVALVSMPYIAINVAEGLDSVDRKLVTMSDAFGRQRSAVVRHVLIPTIAPFAFAGCAAVLRARVEGGAADRGLRLVQRHRVPDPP